MIICSQQKIFLYLLLMTFFTSCSINYSNKHIDYNKIQGLYEYLILDNEKNIVDTLFTTIIIRDRASKDTIRISSDIWGPFWGTKDKFLKIGNVKLDKPNYYPIYFIGLSKNCKWNIEQEVGFPDRPSEFQFNCLSADTTLFINSKYVLENVALIEKKECIDVGGFWNIEQYGIDNENLQLVYLYNYIFNPRDNSVRETKNSLVLNRFIHKNYFDWPDYEKWVAKNSLESKKWLFNNINLEDTPPPPEPPE